MKKKVDIPVGTRFGKLVVIKESDPYIISSGHKYRTFECRCDCGNIVVAKMSDLRTGKRVQCKSCKYHHESLVGRKFGYLTVIEEAGKNKHKQILWKCKCKCGKEVIATGNSLKRCETKSCGCYSAEKTKERMTIDHRSGTRLYKIYYCMLQRCYNENYPQYKDWGGRGITVCDEWKNDFTVFREWAMKNGYKDGLSIDRIDVDRNYEPSNCRWATTKEQAINKRNTVRIEYNGEIHTILEWSEIFCIPVPTIRTRLYRGWNEQEAISTPVKGR